MLRGRVTAGILGFSRTSITRVPNWDEFTFWYRHPLPLLLRKILKTNQIGFCLCFDLLFSRGYGQNLELIGVTGRAWRFFRPLWEFGACRPWRGVALESLAIGFNSVVKDRAFIYQREKPL